MENPEPGLPPAFYFGFMAIAMDKRSCQQTDTA
ncbi:hypothetical protein BN1002_01511 [Bacillus sp. B-jedd]|nr:hypothetical protein BN1002_01511 [Bacillus sp. B-jedd]